MAGQIQEKILDIIIRAIPALLLGGGGLELSGGKLFGKIIFYSYDRISLPAVSIKDRQNMVDELYRTWSGKIATDFLPYLFQIKGLLLLLVLLAVIALVVLKQQVHKKGTAIQKRLYYALSMALFFILTVGLFATADPFWLVAFFLWVAIPIAVYLFYYSKDVLKGSPFERFLYVGMLLLLVVALLGLPANYGRQFFDVELRPVEGMENRPKPEQSLGTFQFGENRLSKKQVYCDVYCSEGRLAIVLFTVPEEVGAEHSGEFLHEMAKELAQCRGPSAPAPSPEEAIIDELVKEISD